MKEYGLVFIQGHWNGIIQHCTSYTASAVPGCHGAL